MPVSSNALLGHVQLLIQTLRPSTFCDIGPGAGKYGRLLRDVMATTDMATKLTAVELDASYVEQFGLRDVYDDVIVCDAVDLINKPSTRFDFVMIGDCIEHMRKSDGVDLINFLVYRCGYIAIIYPIEYPQDEWKGHAQEAHISVWGEADFANMNCIRFQKDGMWLFLIKGYQPTTCLVDEINETGIVYRQFKNEAVPEGA